MQFVLVNKRKEFLYVYRNSLNCYSCSFSERKINEVFTSGFLNKANWTAINVEQDDLTAFLPLWLEDWGPTYDYMLKSTIVEPQESDALHKYIIRKFNGFTFPSKGHDYEVQDIEASFL